MSNEKCFLRKEIEKNRMLHGIHRIDYCSQKQNKEFQKMVDNKEPLPDGIKRIEDSNSFVQLIEPNLSITHDDIMEYLAYLQLDSIKLLKSIQRSLIFFVILTCIGLFGTALFLIL